MTADEFDPQRIVEVLNRHRVEYVLVGGYAAQLYGARRPTYDVDITPSTTLENLNCLSTVRHLSASARRRVPLPHRGIDAVRGARGTADG